MAEMFGGLSSDNGSYFSNSLTQIQSQLENTTALGESVLEALVEESVIEQEAVTQGITVDEKDVDAAIQEAFGFYANGTPTPGVTPTTGPTSTLSAAQLAIVTLTPTQTLAPSATEIPTSSPPAISPTPTVEGTPVPTATAYTLDGYQKQYQEYLTGFKDVNFPEAEFRKAFKVSLLRQKLSDKITADTPTSEEQVWARHILVADEQAAKDVLARLQKGETFDALAKELSTDSSNKDTGGDLGWFGKGKMVAEFSDAAFALKVGEISQPVKSSFGYHIIQVIGHEDRPLSQTAYVEKKSTIFNDWLTKAKTDLGVQKNDVSSITLLNRD